jgi:hypothetical protein
LETKNSNFWNELIELHKWLNKIGKILGSIDSKQAMLKQKNWKEQTNQKVIEQSLKLTNKLFKMAKVKVERLEGQNEVFIEKT